MEELEIFKAALAVALADGTLRRSEKGVLQGLAVKAGVGSASFQAMVESAEQGVDDLVDNVLIQSAESARRAMGLLVSTAMLDGEISGSERDVLVRIAIRLKIEKDELEKLFQSGIARANAIRHRRTE